MIMMCHDMYTGETPTGYTRLNQLLSGMILHPMGPVIKHSREIPEIARITLWLLNIAMENDPFIDDFPIKTSIYKGFSRAMLNNQRVQSIAGKFHHSYSSIDVPGISQRPSSMTPQGLRWTTQTHFSMRKGIPKAQFVI